MPGQLKALQSDSMRSDCGDLSPEGIIDLEKAEGKAKSPTCVGVPDPGIRQEILGDGPKGKEGDQGEMSLLLPPIYGCLVKTVTLQPEVQHR